MTATELPVVPSTVRAACPHDCPDTCAMLVTVADGRALEVRGDPEHPFTRGGLCVKVNNYVDKVYSSERLLYPMRRSGPKGSGNGRSSKSAVNRVRMAGVCGSSSKGWCR